MRIIIIIFIASIWANIPTYSQENQDSTKTRSDFRDKVHFGGGVQLSFGNAYTAVGISPSVIYDFSEKWAGGIGVSYLYVNDNIYNYDYNVLGGSTNLLYNPIEEIQLHTEFEMLKVNQKSQIENNKYWVPAWYVGVGYAISKRGAIGLRYDILWEKDKSIYKDALTPYIRFYF
jgi:long-subunit fatty acid transport protein